MTADLRVEARGEEMMLVGKESAPARMTHYAFGQLARKVKFPAEPLRELPATLSAQIVNHKLAKLTLDKEDAQSSLLFHMPENPSDGVVVRCAVSPQYNRLWNGPILRRLDQLQQFGWQIPPARPAGIDGERTRIATEADVLAISQRNSGLAIKVGDTIAPAGIYVSDHKIFVFMVDESHGVNDGTGHQLGRGFFLENSEVGDGSFALTAFLYDAICGNHIVWGSKEVKEFRMRHVGDGIDDRAFGAMQVQLTEYASSSVSDIEATIKQARTLELGATKDEVIENLFGIIAKKRLRLPQKLVMHAFETAEATPRYGNPRTMWAVVNGLTEQSQRTQYADHRVDIDRAAGELLRIKF